MGQRGHAGVRREARGNGGILPARSRGAHVYGTRRVAVSGCTATPNGLRGAEGSAKGRGRESTCERERGTLRAPRERADACVSPWEAVPALHIATQACKSPFTSSC